MKKLSKLVAVAITAAALFFTSNVKAQTTPANAFRFSIGLETGIPTGPESPKSNFELGGTARLQYGTSANTAITLTSGYYDLFGTNVPGTSNKRPDLGIIPIKVGFKGFFSPNWYFGGEAGAAIVPRNSNTKLDLSPALGYATRSFDLGLRYENFSGQAYSFGIVGLRIAYSL